MAAKKICLLSSIPADPRGGGNGARIFSLARELRGLGHDVHFAFLPSRQSPQFDLELHLRTFGEAGVHRLSRGAALDELGYYGVRAVNKMWRRGLSLVGSKRRHYHHLDEIFPQHFSAEIQRLQAAEQFDAAIAVYVFNSKALLSFPSALKILDTHDRFADRHLVYEDADIPSAGYSISLPVENRGFRRADVVLAIQEEEAERFRTQLGPDADRVYAVSHTLDLSLRVAGEKDDAATFLGSSFTANTQAAGYFLKDILPRILAVRPGFEAIFAGSICKDVADQPGVVKLGRVGEISEAFAQGPICLNPILIGTGINIKLLDAMAAGVPAISTRTGVRGLPDRFRGSVIVVPDDDPQAFADAVVDLATDRQKRNSLAQVSAANGQQWNDEQLEALVRVLEAPRRT